MSRMRTTPSRWMGLSRWQGQWAVWSSWEDDLDVSGGHQRSAWWAWLLLAVGAWAVMLAVDHVDGLRIQQQEVGEQVKRLNKADRQLRMQRALASQSRVPKAAGQAGQPGQSVDVASNAPVLQGAVVPAARRMVGLLAYPWPEHLNLVDAQAAKAQVVMTQLTVSLDGTDAVSAASGARWRLRAFAKDDATALAWASRLPNGELLNREPAAQPFTTRAGTYGLTVSLEMRP